MNNTILLSNGKYFDFTKLETEILDIVNIAHGLSQVCRYAGQCSFPYYVAEHCWHMSYIVDPEIALEALLHDASECVLGDVAKPLKIMMPQYNEMEEKLEINIAKQYKLKFPFPPEIKIADKRMLKMEQLILFPGHDFESILNIEPYKYVHIMGYKPQIIKHMFLKRFMELKR